MVKYRIEFTNEISESYYTLFDYKHYVGDVTYLTGTRLNIKSIANDDDPFSPILSKECEISFFIDQTQNISIVDFLAVEDDDIKVTIFRDELTAPPVFQGFVVVEDSSEPLNGRPKELTVRASDGLPLLKNVELVRSDLSDFVKFNNLTDYIGHILYYVNPSINFRVYYDIYHKTMVTASSPFEQMQVDALTFEKDETTFLDCYSVLENILTSTQCRLFYENGYWHIMSVWQYHNLNGYNWFEFEIVNNEVQQSGSNTNELLQAKIGHNETIEALIDSTIYYKQQIKSVKKTFNYEIPKEIVCNQTLQRGEKIPSLSTSIYTAYEMACWIHATSATGNVAPPLQAYIRRDFDQYAYEKDKFIVIPRQGNGQPTYLQSTEFLVNKGDNLTVTFDTKPAIPTPLNDMRLVAYIMLRGVDGSKWEVIPTNLTHPAQGSWVWVQNNNNFSTMTGILAEFSQDDKGNERWININLPIDNKIPVDGRVQLVFREHSFDNSLSFPQDQSWFKNLQINYQPFINNSFRPVSGDFNLYSQNLKINRTIEDTISISDSPKSLIKGALFVNKILATPEWYRIGYNESMRFMQIQTLIKYNYTFKQFQKIEGTLKGLSLYSISDANIPFGFLPTYLFTDIPKAFILTSFDADYVTGQWRGVLVEIRVNQDQAFDTYDFQYIFK